MRKLLFILKISKSRAKAENIKNNQNFELYRSGFYRKLDESQENTHGVDKKGICAFWLTTWNKKNINLKNYYKQYIFEFLPDT